MAETTAERGTRSLDELPDSVRRLSASPLLYVGAVTVVLANELVELAGLSDLPAVAATFAAALVLLWGQLAVLSYFGWADASPGCGC